MLTQIIHADPTLRQKRLASFLAIRTGSIAVVDSALQIRIQTTFSRFWQERLVSLVDLDAPKVRDLLLKSHYHLQSMLRVEHEALPETYPDRLFRAQSLFDINDALLERKLTSLSNGELRRLLIARAYMQNPAILVLDDPSGALDPSHRISLETALQQISAEGMDVILLAPQEDIQSQEIISKTPHLQTRTLRTVEPSTQLVQFESLTVRFDETVIINELDWNIYQGEHWLITGSNGSGKSTLLSFLTADHPQMYRNRMHLLGQVPGQGLNVWEHKKQIGFCSPEFHHQWPKEGSLLQVVCSGFDDPHYPTGLVLWEQKNDAHTALLALGLNATQLFAHSSYIEQRLTLVARALIRHPRLIILDEPDQGIDQLGRDRLWSFLDQHIRASTSTLILVSHHTEHLPDCITHELCLG
jgi:molybdate transport system ATP-binding protein